MPLRYRKFDILCDNVSMKARLWLFAMKPVNNFAESCVKYAVPKSTPWRCSSSNSAGYLVNGKLSLAMTKQLSNFLAVRSRGDRLVHRRK